MKHYSGTSSVGIYKLTRSNACLALEETDEMLRILKTKRISRLTHIASLVQKKGLGSSEEFVLNVILSGDTGFTFDQIAEIVGAKSHFVGKILDIRQTIATCRGIVDILVEQLVETRHHTGIEHLTHSKLATVVAQAVVKKQFDIGNYEVFRKTVDRMLQRPLYTRETVLNIGTLVGRQVESLVRFITEE